MARPSYRTFKKECIEIKVNSQCALQQQNDDIM